MSIYRLDGLRIALYSVLVAGVVGAVLVFAAMPEASAQSLEQRRAELEAQMRQIEREISELDGELSEVRDRRQTLQSEVQRLNTEIRRTELAIQGLDLTIRQTEAFIQERQIHIEETQENIDRRKATISEYLRTFHKYSERSMMEVLLSKSLSEFFQEVSTLEGLQENARASLEQLLDLKEELEEEREELELERQSHLELRALQEVQRRTVATQRNQHDQLLQQTRGQEARYQQLISQRQRDIAAIRQQLSSLGRAGVGAEDAVSAAELAAARTGIRTAFLLALLEVETGRRFADGVITAGSNLGSGNWRTDMPTRDHAAFMQITSELGLNPDTTPVSAKPSYGWGGAMGPAQFIPSTWVRYKDRIAQVTGNNPPNPWNINDAFTGAAIYLADFGAAAQTPDAEARSARAYISGNPNCTQSICRWYSQEILRIASLIERSL